MKPSRKPPRYVPDEPLPPYAYVSGQFPHPISDPAGHSHGRTHPPVPPLDPMRWHECRDYLYGVDLFNHGYYWEAHEVWEGLWHACGRGGTTGRFLKGLIRLAAAGVKAREMRTEGVRNHARRAAELFEQVEREAGSTFLGLELNALRQWAREVAETVPLAQAQPGTAVEIVFPFQLLPQPL